MKQAFSLGIEALGIGFPAPPPNSRFLLMQTLGGDSEASSKWLTWGELSVAIVSISLNSSHRGLDNETTDEGPSAH